MTTNRKTACSHFVTINLDRLSKGVDQILKRWVGPKRPSKLALLNDLAAAIRPGTNWGALKLSTPTPAHESKTDNTSFIPKSPKDAKELPARSFPIVRDSDSISIYELTEDALPLFSMRHEGDPIIGLELSVSEGNGYCDVSIFARIILVRGDVLSATIVYADEMDPEIARLVYCAVQNLQCAAIYPTFAQADCRCLRVILGPSHVVAALPDGPTPSDVPSQGVRVLFDEDQIHSDADLDVSLRLTSAALPYLKIDRFSHTDAIQFRLTQPRTQIWSPVDFETPELHGDQTLFRRPKDGEWMHDGDFLWDLGVFRYGKLGEALDLALALVDIDDPDLYLHVSLTPEPKNKRPKLGRSGGLLTGWRILKLRHDIKPQILSLGTLTQNRLENGLNGWAAHEGYLIIEDKTKVVTEALVPRDVRRASHHMKQVQAMMNA